MSHTCIATLVYGVPVSDAEIYDWNQKHKKEFLDEEIDIGIHGCKYITHGDMDVEAHCVIGISLSEHEAYAGEVVNANAATSSDWDTDLAHALSDLELDYKEPRWLLLCFCG